MILGPAFWGRWGGRCTTRCHGGLKGCAHRKVRRISLLFYLTTSAFPTWAASALSFIHRTSMHWLLVVCALLITRRCPCARRPAQLYSAARTHIRWVAAGLPSMRRAIQATKPARSLVTRRPWPSYFGPKATPPTQLASGTTPLNTTLHQLATGHLGHFSEASTVSTDSLAARLITSRQPSFLRTTLSSTATPMPPITTAPMTGPTKR